MSLLLIRHIAWLPQKSFVSSWYKKLKNKEMVKLSISDKYDGLDKIEELRSAIGYVYSDNHSGTHSSKLVAVSECGNVAYTIEVSGPYSNFEPAPGITKQPSWLVWNGMFS
jgi:hypothetical protein